jgi:hypothetical protein
MNEVSCAPNAVEFREQYVISVPAGGSVERLVGLSSLPHGAFSIPCPGKRGRGVHEWMSL